MKRINNIGYLLVSGLFLLLSVTGCSGMLDDIRPKDKIPQDQLTEDDLGKLLNGVYAEMEELVFKFYMDGDVKGENFKAGPGFSLNDPMLMAPSSSDVLDKWQKSFTTLKQINFLVENFEASDNTDSKLVRQVGGTAYYFRALIYYNLVTRWGGVPILPKRTYDVVPISPEADVWNFILEDLQKAENLLPNFTDRFYVSLSACEALYAKVYLALKNYEQADIYASKVLANSSFALSTNSEEYASPFISNTSSKEVVFALANKRSSSLLLFYQTVNDIDPTWDYSPSADCYENLYKDTSVKKEDIRRQAVFNEDNSRVIKFPNGSTGQFITNEQPSQTPIVVTRIAEMYLIKAEAKGAINGLSALKDFMTKRYSQVNLPSSLSDKEFQDQILDERHREFYGEGQRWYDLKRTNRFDLFQSLNGRDYLMYFPVPQSEIDLAGEANYPQNNGYN